MPKALVLGGGGVAGIAWELGVLDALAIAGVDLTTADRIVGTSAGSAVGAQLCTGESLDSLCARQLVPAEQSAELQVESSLDSLIEQFAACFDGAPDALEVRRRLGAVALGAPTVEEAARIAVIESRLSSHEWSERELLVTAVDAFTGEFRVFDKNSGVPLVSAVTASCAVPGIWPPVTIGDTRFMDGGVNSGSNADLAEGCEIVVIIAPFAGGFGPTVEVEAEALRSTGAIVEVIAADVGATEAFGTNVLDPATRAPSLREGRRQGALEAQRIAKVWQ
ncbi:MAG: patatin-like phospholipase family protein [Actinobacteria bacterium]|nr:patatin-like phospholipase family protein [Actinomycetota bacterium]